MICCMICVRSIIKNFRRNEAMGLWLEGKDEETAKLLGVPGA
jgi:hypothetical protein